jgi:hypothetical protein
MSNVNDDTPKPPGWNPSHKTRYPSGRSGNPLGRPPRRSLDDGSILAILAREAPRKSGGKPQTFAQAVHAAMIRNADRGDLAAIELVHKEESRELLRGVPPAEKRPATMGEVMDQFERDLFTALGQFADALGDCRSEQEIREAAARKLGKLGPKGSKSWIAHVTIHLGLGLHAEDSKTLKEAEAAKDPQLAKDWETAEDLETAEDTENVEDEDDQ